MKLQKFDYEMKDNAKQNRTSKIIIVITVVLAAFVIYKTYALFQVSTSSYSIVKAVVGDFSATPESCFTIDSDGQITGYDSTCEKNVKIPATVNGIQVKSIDTNAFKKIQENVETTTYTAPNYDASILPNAYIVMDNEDFDNVLYAVADDETVKGYLESMAEGAELGDITIYVKGTDTIPEKEVGRYIQYYKITGTTEEDLTNLIIKKVEEGTTSTLLVDTLDLSKSIYLDTIEREAFSICNKDTSNKITECTDGLDGLTFGTNDKAIKLENASFGGLKTDTLDIYSSDLYTADTSVSENLLYAFAYSNIQTVNVKYADTYKTINIPSISMCYVKNINIEEGIEDIGSGTFWLSNSETDSETDTLTLASTVKTIGKMAFYGNDYEVLNLNTGLTTIGEYAFSGIDSLNELIIPNTVTYIDTDAFYSIESIGNLQLSSSLQTIGESAFGRLSSVNNFTIPSSVTNIGAQAFGNLPSTVTITIGAGSTDGITLGTNWNGSATVN